MTTDLHTAPSSTSTVPGARTSTYGRHMCAVMLTAFALSVAHTVYAAVQGIEDPTFTVDTPLAWGFYAAAFGVSALALRTTRAAQAVVLAFLVATLLIGVFYYPTTFGPEKQTVFGWFENDVYLGLLCVAAYLGVLRWRDRSLLPS